MSGNILIVGVSPIDRKIIRTVLEKRLEEINLFEEKHYKIVFLSIK
jgi:hypothetical protein